VPAPAVIPAPRAYINAVAVKGFVVELWVDKPLMAQSLSPDRRPPHLQPVNIRNRNRGIVIPFPLTHVTHARGGTPMILL